MRAVLQKVLQASVTVGDRVVGEIGPGVCVLIGISHEDTTEDMEYMAKKILSIRVFDDDSGAMWKKSVKDLNLQVLCVSQFTLYGKTTKGSKPDFHQAMKSSESRQFFDDFVYRLGQLYDPLKIQTGEFGAMMKVALVNDGPVTLELDSRKFSYDKPSQQQNAAAAKAVAKEQRRQGFSQKTNDVDKADQI
ncbi:D-tyrosyl-tRNA(Tyr) deacylase [Coemansia sp. RSA 1722]|nr:D-tyrosyl-tRNA(Tyr) deacylase [Coemansia sp. RSA 486]KAJ2593414.1 D-tyrosyl-tRNA(Tyr) deacylase [Coemansia sp. RSA 1722]KAJ2603173.1 D-tyrosyl-tRNA(Tyr) deacylase [Coemansia sp. RSA 1721]KAJ2639560.1 D-tyrosyl-tRNA(Tyr) deacylase [Coemansia sp. RSA 1286]